MKNHRYQPPDGSQHRFGASAGIGHPTSYTPADATSNPPADCEALKKLNQTRHILRDSGLQLWCVNIYIVVYLGGGVTNKNMVQIGNWIYLLCLQQSQQITVT
jgi:hypothetical protein